MARPDATLGWRDAGRLPLQITVSVGPPFLWRVRLGLRLIAAGARLIGRRATIIMEADDAED